MSQTIDHCAEAERLRKVLTDIATGQLANTVRFGEDEVRYAKADTDELRRQIAHHEDLCARSSGAPVRRRRYGLIARSRSY